MSAATTLPAAATAAPAPANRTRSVRPLISVLLTLVLVYEDPFAGDIVVSPTAMKRVMTLMTDR